MKQMTNEELYQLAKKRVMAKKLFSAHLRLFLAVSLLLVAISVANNATWFIFPVAGWGVVVVLHKLYLNSLLNGGDEVEKEFAALKEKYK